MSTRVIPSEYSTLLPVPPENYGGATFNVLGPCDLQPSHGRAQVMYQTPDHRAIALCCKCAVEVVKEMA